MKTSRTILVVDGDDRYRQMVKAMILRYHPGTIVDEAQSLHGALQQIRRRHPDVIITEIDLRGRRRVSLPNELAALHPEGVIVVLTSCDQPEYREVVLQGGAHYFVSKSLPHHHRLRTIVDAELPSPGARKSVK